MDCLNTRLIFAWIYFQRCQFLLMSLNFHFKFFMWPHNAAWSKSLSVVWCRPCRRGDINFSIWHVTSCDHVIRFVQLHYELCLTICQQRTKFGGYKSSGGWNIPFLVCHVTLCNKVVRRTCYLMGAFTLPQVINLPSFIAIDLARESMCYTCHVTTHHHFVRGSYESIGRFF